MTALDGKAPGTVDTVSGAEMHYERLRANATTDAISTLRELQLVVAGIARAVDRLDRTASSVIGCIR